MEEEKELHELGRQLRLNSEDITARISQLRMYKELKQLSAIVKDPKEKAEIEAQLSRVKAEVMVFRRDFSIPTRFPSVSSFFQLENLRERRAALGRQSRASFTSHAQSLLEGKSPASPSSPLSPRPS